MVLATNLGFPRIGAKRELKKILESFWAQTMTEKQLTTETQALRLRHWTQQQQAGLTHIPSHDFSLYDHVLDTICMVGAVPRRYGWKGGRVDLRTYFAMARGLQDGTTDIPAMEMTKWFDTNYHYIVPEFEKNQQFTFACPHVIDAFVEAKAAGVLTRPGLLGPVSFLLLGKAKDPSIHPLALLPQLLPLYATMLQQLAQHGAEWVQIDEPCLILDLAPDTRAACATAYATLTAAAPQLKLLFTTYFGALGDNLPTVAALPVAGLHIDCVRAPEQLDAVLAAWPKDRWLSLGLVDGRNVWRTDLAHAMTLVQRTVAARGTERLMIAPACSLMFSPVDLAHETTMDTELKSWLAFAQQKLEEIAFLAQATTNAAYQQDAFFTANQMAMATRRSSARIHHPTIQQRVRDLSLTMFRRQHTYAARKAQQQARFQLPPCPTTTIGSFPQTKEVRAARADFKAGRLSAPAYEAYLRAETEKAIRFQEEIDLDVLVHGEFERTDMVEHFGQLLQGFAFTQNGWVQSYGSRCVRPPIIFGDVQRTKPMTVEWSRFAQSLTKRPMKGMLTGPVTILQWSFVRDDQPRATTCKQIGLAIRDEVVDLEQAGIRMIQIDEPAIREGLPLRRSVWAEYLQWAVDCFLLASCGVKDETQIHTHMCYSEFNDIIEAIARMDADVISIESSRSQMELLHAFVDFRYPNDIGPGTYDIHSPRVPSTDEMVALLQRAARVVPVGQLWVNPDCGLKTRAWPEVRDALQHMVAAAKVIRREFASKAA